MLEPSSSAYWPVLQSVHSATLDVVENLPAAHLAHVVAPPLVPLFVIEPALHFVQSLASFDPSVSTYLPAPQSVHLATFDCVENLPAAHLSHVVAPALAPLFVIEPAAQAVHDESVELVE